MHASFAIYSALACVQRTRMSCTARHTAFSSLLPLLLLLSEANGASIAPNVTATAAAGAAVVAMTTVGPPSTTSPAALVAWPCLRGYGVLHEATATQQTMCERCKDGVTFSNVVSTNASCMSCNPNVYCPEWEYHVSCTRLNDAGCRGRCPADQYYSLFYLSCDFCLDTCRKGWEIVKDCTNQTDAVCGPAPTTAPLATTAGTTVVTSNSSNTTVQSASTAPSDSEHTSQLPNTGTDSSSSSGSAVLVIAIVVPLVALLIVAAALAVYCLRRRWPRAVAVPASMTGLPAAGLGNGSPDQFHALEAVACTQASSADGGTVVNRPTNGDVHPQPVSNTPPAVTTACYLETELPGTPPKGRQEIPESETRHSETLPEGSPQTVQSRTQPPGPPENLPQSTADTQRETDCNAAEILPDETRQETQAAFTHRETRPTMVTAV